MVEGGERVKRERTLFTSRIDFSIDDKTFIEVKTPLERLEFAATSMTAPKVTGGYEKKSPAFFERLIRHFNDIAKNLKLQRQQQLQQQQEANRISKEASQDQQEAKKEHQPKAVLLMCYLMDSKPFVPPPLNESNQAIMKAALNAKRAGVESWQLNLLIDETGVSLRELIKLQLFAETKELEEKLKEEEEKEEKENEESEKDESNELELGSDTDEEESKKKRKVKSMKQKQQKSKKKRQT
eukprot:TRINITY_DN6358_c0_g1_i1.p1 TRINITY_DN6358_c0_g1~~TRINITY_DN6358_c0_g1_i1.p1  ORF type:complete len:240 (-),score=80.53 TRINITY_DN6358_c0_g1_i1:101-820(-)